ncbi:hypothetical protein [Clostridium botulinum]|uniref:Uncharacterized protein n=1 Tax=Clostridium botulinum TaxID=1491 RepID=A0A6G4HN01_CLOBO|nr:hypothetical protein [Clostridium botulinum]MBO0571161.1 hypothetical protein [Clostridium botulinum]NFJ62184.1 hypothetical protein [Clostridium botulinum]NFJ68187.1 hypothetical protein [Clostridium botulinum]NFQ62983.1 hypothetical protein [Clostridium botulinum]NFR18914.1 hypothetical protein [Clostridium botulinum]
MIKDNFKYVLEGTQIDFFFSAFSKEQLIESYREESSRYGYGITFEKKLENNYDFVKSTVKEICGESPHTIRYFSIPRYGWGDMDICALAKIENDGTTFMFTNNREFAEFISDTSGYSFSVKAL